MTLDVRSVPVGVELLVEGRFKDALAPLRLALSLGDASPSTVLNLAIAEDRAGDRDRGRRLMQQLAVRLPEWDEPVLRLAESLRATGEYAAAEEAYQHVLELAPDRQEALIALGGLLLMRGEAQAAHNLLRHCCDIVPDNAEAWNTLGLALYETTEVEWALSAFVRAQELRSDCLEYILNGVDAAAKADQSDAELVRLSLLCEQHPLNPSFHIGRGMLLEHMGRRLEAIDALEAATEMTPDVLVPLRLLGGLLVRSNRISQAEQVLRQVCELDPDNPQVHSEYGVVLMRSQRHAEARTVMQDILDRHGLNTLIMSNLANATACVGRQEEAVKIARQAIALNPTEVLPRRTLCNTLSYCDGTTGAELLAALRDCSAVLPRAPQPPLENNADPGRLLVVGLLSEMLRSHPVGWLTVAGFEALDPTQFNLVCLTNGNAPTDPITRRYRTIARKWMRSELQRR